MLNEDDKLVCVKVIGTAFSTRPKLYLNEIYTFNYKIDIMDGSVLIHIKEHPGHGFSDKCFITLTQDRRKKIIKLKENINGK